MHCPKCGHHIDNDGRNKAEIALSLGPALTAQIDKLIAALSQQPLNTAALEAATKAAEPVTDALKKAVEESKI